MDSGCAMQGQYHMLYIECAVSEKGFSYYNNTKTHQQKGWKSVNLAHPFSSASVAAGWVSGVSQAEKPTPAAGAFEFTSPKSATQPVAEY